MRHASHLLVLLSLISQSAYASTADRAQMLVLGCYLPIPDGYVLNTREREYHTLYEASVTRVGGRINVDSWNSSLSDRDLELLEGPEIHGHLAVLRVRSSTAPPEPLYEFVIIHNGKQELQLWGAARALQTELVQACLANPAPS